ncbi:hypothetical protein GCM10027275_42340 [Rhabdobacter roseus]|uniref:4-amino-4-deoxy-L-arabinose transferase-like glycosyltransferase n=1 Tax=Rhabdobacter roseus TaxID=1655419 RepID=A0A840TY47_9BACT|nr:glycosyltransferase family 39 protein [Rhabdobacter roseus]MBB5286213.1 4-amino-4-deoxy-L-arabinose transferase-like glycosyltransferase [Rhabdobacter roseus]
MKLLHRTDYLFVGLGVLLVYGLGLFLPILDSDPAFNALVALRMHQTGNYVELYDHFMPYLDKPHLTFWLAAASYKLFGVSAWAYRLPSVLVALLGIYATYRLGKAAYNRETGLLAAVILATTQAFMLGNHDVRMDALLTGLVALAAWQFYEYLQQGTWRSILLGGFLAGLAFDTKGMVGVGVVGVALLIEVLHRRAWERLWSVKVLGGLAAFAVAILPVLWCFYLQFDLHPEQVIAGRREVSGVWFMLWEQNFERMSGGRFGKAGAGDPFFFFHTLLWAALPWSLLLYASWATRVYRVRQVPLPEWFTGGGALACLVLFSLSSFKLPHYLNVLFPLMAVWLAGWLVGTWERPHPAQLRFVTVTQWIITVLMLGVAYGLVFWVFGSQLPAWLGGTFVVLGLLLFRLIFLVKVPLRRALLFSAWGTLLVNLMLNGHVYPALDTYQGGRQLARLVEKHQVPMDHLYFTAPSPVYYNLELDAGTLLPPLDREEVVEELYKKKTIWVITPAEYTPAYVPQGARVKSQHCIDDYHVTRLTGKFLNPATRSSTLEQHCLLELERL